MVDFGTGIGVPVLRATQGVERTGDHSFPQYPCVFHNPYEGNLSYSPPYCSVDGADQ